MFGYQVAFCWRNTAIYGGLFLFGILYGLARDRNIVALRWVRKPIPLWALILMLVPMAADGFTHIFGLRDMVENVNMDMWYGSLFSGSQLFSANWWLRIITGLLAALGLVWFLFHRVNAGVAASEELRFSYQQYLATRRAGAQLASPPDAGMKT